MTENTDYAITYKNNVNAASYTEENAPSMTVKMKGQYSGSRTLNKTAVKGSEFWKDPIEYSEDKMTSEGIVQC